MTSPKYCDRYFGIPIRISRTPKEYPFRKNGDITTAFYTATYVVEIDRFFPTASGTEDPENPGYYLIVESTPDIFQGSLATFTRAYSTVPLQQIEPGSMFITKPDIPGSFPQVFGGFVVFKPIATIASYDAYSPKTVDGDSGAPGGLPTGGTFTLTFGANTTGATAYNATAAIVQANLNALASITSYGGVTVTGSNTAGFTVLFNYTAISAAVGSLTGATASSVVTSQNNGLIQSIVIEANWTSPLPLGASSLTPSGANPILTGGTGSIYGAPLIPFSVANIAWSVGNAYSDVPATGGTYTLTVYGQTTAALNWNDSAATVQLALNALGNVSAKGGYTVVAVPAGGIQNSSSHVGGFHAYLPLAAFTGGTYTLTVLGQTTGAIAYNASLGAIEAAINALSNVTARGGAIVSGSGFSGDKISITITFADIPAMSGSAASLTPSGTSVAIAASNSQRYSQGVTFGASSANTRLLTVVNHGYAAGDTLFALDAWGAYYPALSAGITFPSSNSIQITAAAGAVYSAVSSIVQIGKRMIVGYSATATQTRVKYITDFYLPGVSPGIATMDDVPLPVYQGDSASLLSGIFSRSASVNYQVGELVRWRESAILARTTTTLNAATL